jgi:Tol biopolymer transport system component
MSIENTDGSNERIIYPSNKKYFLSTYSWAPDKKRIAVSVFNTEDQTSWQIIEIPVDGGEEKLLPLPLNLRRLSVNWFPDGKGMLLKGLDEATGLRQLWYLSYPDCQLQRITSDSNDYWHAEVSTDGNSIFAFYPQDSNDIRLTDKDDLEHAKKITTRSGVLEDVSWTPDGRILFSAGASGL